jgi:hypothetical protein
MFLSILFEFLLLKKKKMQWRTRHGKIREINLLRNVPDVRKPQMTSDFGCDGEYHLGPFSRDRLLQSN